jgi:hypothetical protein
MLDIIKEVFFIIVSLAGTIVAGALVWFLNEKVGAERVRKANELLEKIQQEFFMKETWVREAVRYAEEKFIDGAGSKKYDAVMDFVVRKAKEHGIEITKEELDVLIESQVHTLKRELRDAWLGIIKDPSNTGENEEANVSYATPALGTQDVFNSNSTAQGSNQFSVQNQENDSFPKIYGAEVHKQSLTLGRPFKNGQQNEDQSSISPEDGSDLNMMNNKDE